MKIIEIGNKPLKELSAEDLRQIVIIEGACPDLEYWEEPVITDFDNTMFSDKLVLDYDCLNKKEKYVVISMDFFFNFKELYYHYKRYYAEGKWTTSGIYRVGLKTIKYLIDKGYDIPIYDKK